jgi:hypothetical protein
MHPVRPTLHAWADESMRVVHAPVPVHLLAATIAEPERCDDVRSLLRSFYGGRKLHWRELDRLRRGAIVRAMADLEAEHLVVAARPLDVRRQERARAICLRRLAWELERRSVELLTLEARDRSLMRRDISTVDALRASRVISPRLRVEHERPSVEPMLWLPDQAAGTVVEAICGSPRWLETISHRVEVVDLEL